VHALWRTRCVLLEGAAGDPASTLLGSLLWCSVLAWFGMTLGQHPELLAGSLHRFFVLVLVVAAVLGALYYAFVRPVSKIK